MFESECSLLLRVQCWKGSPSGCVEQKKIPCGQLGAFGSPPRPGPLKWPARSGALCRYQAGREQAVRAGSPGSKTHQRLEPGIWKLLEMPLDPPERSSATAGATEAWGCGRGNTPLTCCHCASGAGAHPPPNLMWLLGLVGTSSIGGPAMGVQTCGCWLPQHICFPGLP